MTADSPLTKYASAGVALFLFLSIGVHFAKNSSSGILGKDESLYVILAKGNSEDASIHAPTGNYLDAMEKGVQRTSDPPGVFLLLHAWEKISYSETWLRLLPCLFFVISVITIIRVGLLLKFPSFFSVCLGFLPLASPRMVMHAFEIRAYGMEICCTYLMLYAALKLLIKLNEGVATAKTDWVILTLVMLGGLSSRFSFVISSSSMYFVLWLAIIRGMKRPNFKSNALFAATSSFVSLAAFAGCFGMMQYLTKTPPGSIPPDPNMYAIPGTFIDIVGYFIKQILLIPSVLFGELAGHGALFLYTGRILLFGIVVIGLVRAYDFVMNRGLSGVKADSILYFGVFAFPLAALIISGALAVMGIHPFSITSRWSIYLQPAFHLFIMGVGRVFAFQVENDSQKGRGVLAGLCRAGFAAAVAILALIYGYHYSLQKTTFRMGGPQETVRVIGNMFSDTELKNVDYWYISVGEASSFKYHALYGGLKGKLSPGAQIIIENRSAGVTEIICSEMGNIYKEARHGSKVVMVLGHVDAKDAKRYGRIFKKYFPNLKYGKFETSSEQIMFAVR